MHLWCRRDSFSGVRHWEARPSSGPAKVRAIVDWPVSKNQKDLRKWLGLANLHKYSANYADMARPVFNLLKKDVDWCWGNTKHEAFQEVRESILHAPMLALPDPDRSFNVVCDALTVL